MTRRCWPRRPGLIATARSRPARHRPLHQLRIVRQRPLIQQLIRAQRRQINRSSMNVQPDRYRRSPKVSHGRRPPYVALPAHPGNPRTCAGADHSRQSTGRHHTSGSSILSSWERIWEPGAQNCAHRRPPAALYKHLGFTTEHVADSARGGREASRRKPLSRFRPTSGRHQRRPTPRAARERCEDVVGRPSSYTASASAPAAAASSARATSNQSDVAQTLLAPAHAAYRREAHD